MSEEIADFLSSARENIEQNGWVQGSFRNEEGVCSVGGMLSLLDLPDDVGIHSPFVRRACESLVKLIGLATHEANNCDLNGECTCVVNWITAWNDADDRTMQEVLDTFAKAEKVERMGYDPELGYSDV